MVRKTINKSLQVYRIHVFHKFVKNLIEVNWKINFIYLSYFKLLKFIFYQIKREYFCRKHLKNLPIRDWA